MRLCCGKPKNQELGRADDTLVPRGASREQTPSEKALTEEPYVQEPSLKHIPVKKNTGDVSDIPSKQLAHENESYANIDFEKWLEENVYVENVSKDKALDRDIGVWTEIRLFMSSTFIDTHAERDTIVKNVIPEVNRKMAPNFIRIIPVDLRWGVLAEESKSCFDIQKTCLNQVDNCRLDPDQTPWFLALRTERYGWIQSDMMPSEGFERPVFFRWMDKLKKEDKKVSITSLEVCHASKSPKKLPPYPTIFCYKRNFDEEATKRLKDEQLRWVFEFEYTNEEITDPDFKYQYNFDKKSKHYAEDREKLDKFLKDKPHVLFSEFNAGYQPGGAYYTCKRENAKSFGVGYTTDLDDFAAKVEEDLLTAIRMNFLSPDSKNLDKYVFESIQHENAVKLKASTFVGRTEMMKAVLNHCQTKDKRNTMILHGTPGCGKSGLLAAVANKVLPMREKNNFVFIHAVDSCPGSSILEKFLRRINFSLRSFRRKQGEIKLSVDPPEAISDLKLDHFSMIRETGEKYPKSQIIIIVDAVNQFHESMRSWDMWWLAPSPCPNNIRILISTLNEENNTFAHAQEACPDAHCVEVVHMSEGDRQDMVSKTLERYNKKLTTYEDGLLGNQMETLLAKSSSPLFLIAACEALRKFGIFEKVSEYIKLLPNTISELFSFLLDEWSEEYGKEFVEDVAGLLCLSKDGLLENEINDLLRYKEEKVQTETGKFLYECSFARIYDSISSFLAAGGGGYLRFFHDQLKFTVRDKFLDQDFTLKTHQWMRDFFLSVIEPQLVDQSQEKPPDYYEHALQQLFHHQLAVANLTGDTLDCLKDSLRSIYFVRERIIYNQQNSLNEEYVLAIDSASGSDISALKDWVKFVQLYASNIKEFPQFAHNMASNQAPSSDVTVDTLVLEAPRKNNGYPLKWMNIPQVDDPMAVKFDTSGVDCVASSPKNDVVAVANQSNAVILDQTSGELLHKLPIAAYSVYLSEDAETLYVGGSKGSVHCFDVSTGTLKCTGTISLGKPITWLGAVGTEYIVAGTGSPRKAICWDDHTESCCIMTMNTGSLEYVHSWENSEPAWHYCYNKSTDVVISTHKGMIKGWNYLDDAELFSETDNSGCVYSIASHPTDNRVISGNNELQVIEWEISKSNAIILRTIQLPTISGWAFGGVWSVSYNHDGGDILCTEPQTKSIMIYNEASVRIGELKGHSDCINIITRIPETTQFLSADRDQTTILWKPPATDIDACKQAIDEKVQWVGFSPDETHFATATDSALRIWDTATQTELRSAQFDGFYNTCGAFHPDEQHILVSGRMCLYVFDVKNLELVKQHNVLQSSDGSMSAMAMSPDGSKFISVECRNMDSQLSEAFVWNCSDVMNASHHFTKKGYNSRMFSCAINCDSKKGLIGGHAGTIVIDMETGDTLCQIKKGCFFVTFVPNSTDILLAEGSTLLRYGTDGDPEMKCKYSGHSGSIKSGHFANKNKYFVTAADDGVLRIYEAESGSCLYAFFNHRAEQFNDIAIKKDDSLIIAPNSNGMLYILAP